MNSRQLENTKQSISNFLSMVNPILDLLVLSPEEMAKHPGRGRLTLPEQGLSFLIATFSLGIGLTTEKGRFTVAQNILCNVGSLGLSLFQKNSSPRFTYFKDNARFNSCSQEKDTHFSELNEWHKKFKDDFNIDKWELSSYGNNSDFKIMHEHLTKLDALLEENSISQNIINKIPTATILEIALDKKITLSALNSPREILMLAIQLNCVNIPLQIIKSNYDQFHHNEFLTLSIHANNLKMSNYFINHWQVKVDQPLKFVFNSTISVCMTAFALFEGYKQFNQMFDPLSTTPSRKIIKKLEDLLVIQVGALGLFIGSLRRIRVESLELNFQNIQFNKIFSSKEIINLILCSDPNALINLYMVSPEKAKVFVNKLLEDETTLKKFFKNDRGRTLLMLKRVFYDVKAFENVRTASELIKRVSSSCKELRKNAKVLSQACYSKNYNFFSRISRDGCLNVISETRDAQIHTKEMAFKIARPYFNKVI